jgi:hypothetical protein
MVFEKKEKTTEDILLATRADPCNIVWFRNLKQQQCTITSRLKSKGNMLGEGIENGQIICESPVCIHVG